MFWFNYYLCVQSVPVNRESREDSIDKMGVTSVLRRLFTTPRMQQPEPDGTARPFRRFNRFSDRHWHIHRNGWLHSLQAAPSAASSAPAGYSRMTSKLRITT